MHMECHNVTWVILGVAGPVTPYDDRDPVNIGSDNGLLPGGTIIWIDVDFSSVRSSGNHTRAISQEIAQPSTIKFSSNIAYLNVI